MQRIRLDRVVESLLAAIHISVLLAVGGSALSCSPECTSDIDCEFAEVCDEGNCRLGTCGEILLSDVGECTPNTTPGCRSEELEDFVVPSCFCDPGFANIDEEASGCEDPTFEYEACCECLSSSQCLSTSESQCVQALEAAAEVGIATGCAQDDCPGACAKVLCDGFGCTGY